MLWKLVKFILILIILAIIALTAYAYIGPILFADDFAAPQTQVVKPVTLTKQ